MIIKSLSRKTASFGQLYDYFNRHSYHTEFIAWNLPTSDMFDKETIIQEFERNANFLKTRKRGNVLYHEVISFKFDPNVSLEKQIYALRDVAHHYLKMRGERLLGYGRLHLEKEHLHFHVMLSSNEMDQSNRHRLSRKQYADIQKNCDTYLKKRYPTLNHASVYTQNKTLKSGKIKQREYEFMKRTGEKSQKQEVEEILQNLLEVATTQTVLKKLNQAGFTLYKRGQQTGVSYNGRKYRLSTLDLKEAYEKAMLQENTNDIPGEDRSPEF